MSSEVARYADEAMFQATPLTEEGEEVRPRVTVITMTRDPLRVMTAVSALYNGRVVRDPSEITDEEALGCLAGYEGGKIVAPLEWIQIALLIEGVTRAFTHQMVRQRTATFVQESLRFAVKDNAAFEVALPPSIDCLKDDDPRRVTWANAVEDMAGAYNGLINAGVPAEDARGLLPTNIATRIHYRTDLRNLANTAGMRLCSQAQAEWKAVWLEIVRAILEYGPRNERWQQREIVKLFKPVCYQTGSCGFNTPIDRWCVIRDRVNAHAANGEPPKVWIDIDPHEPLRPDAARRSVS